MTPPFLSIVIPAYNEAKRLPSTLVKIKEFLDTQEYQSEVLVVDDGSTDLTLKEVEKILPQFPQLRLITNEKNKGKGGVVRQGMLEATGQWRLFMDADFATPVSEVNKLYPFTDSYEAIIGSRYSHGGKIHIKQSLKRRILSRTGNLAIQVLLLPKIADTQCGFKLFSKEAAEKIFPKQTMSGWAFDMELLTIAKVQGYNIKEVGVDWFDSPDSALRASRAAVRSLHDLFEIRRKRNRGFYC